MKTCTKCHLPKPIKGNYRYRSGKQSHTLHTWCNQCHYEYKVSRPRTKWERLAHNINRKGVGRVSIPNLRDKLGEPCTCYLCGLPVSWETAEIDHVAPISRGGINDINNLKWAHRICNRVKHNLNIDEMLELFQQIIDNQNK